MNKEKIKEEMKRDGMVVSQKAKKLQINNEQKKDILVGILYGIIGIFNIIIFVNSFFCVYLRLLILIISFLLGFVALYFLGKPIKLKSF